MTKTYPPDISSFLQSEGDADGAGDRKFVFLRNNLPEELPYEVTINFDFAKKDIDGV